MPDQNNIEIPKEKLDRLTPDRRKSSEKEGVITRKIIRASDSGWDVLAVTLAAAIWGVPWLMGIAIAQGWAYFPLYAYYVVVEHFMKLYGLI